MKISLTRLTPLLVALKTADAAQLIPCPDCGGDVSRRVLMCPNCGLKGEVIAEAAKAGDAVVAPKQEGAQGFYKVWVSDAPIEAE